MMTEGEVQEDAVDGVMGNMPEKKF